MRGRGSSGRKSLATIDGEIREGIRSLITAGDLEDAVQALRDGLKAEMTVRTTSAKGERQRYERVPDRTTRIMSARLLIEFGDGKAIQRVHQHTTSDETRRLTPREIFGRLAQDGDQMLALLQAYVGVAKESQTKTVEQVIDLPTLEDLES